MMQRMVTDYARAYILTLIRSLLMPNTLGRRLDLMYLLVLAELNNVLNYNLGLAILACPYRVLYHIIDFN